MLGGFGELGHVLQGLAQRCRGEREPAIAVELGAIGLLASTLVRPGRRGGLLGRNRSGAFELRTRGQPVDFDHAGIAHAILHTKGVAHRACDHLQLDLVLRGERHEHDEEAHEQAHEIGEGHEPAVTAMCLFAFFLEIRPCIAAK